MGVELAYRLFVPIGGKFVQFRAAGDTLTQRRLDDLRAKGVQVLHIHRKEYLGYVNELELAMHKNGVQPGSEESALRVRELMMAYFRHIEERRKMESDYLEKLIEISGQLPIAIGSNKAVALRLLQRNTDPAMYFSNHAVNTSVYAVTIGMKLKYNLPKLQTIAMAGLVANIGIIKIPKEILYKPGELTEEEFEVVKKHPILGAEVLKLLMAPEEVVEAVLHHHERFDGKGYPHGLEKTSQWPPACCPLPKCLAP